MQLRKESEEIFPKNVGERKSRMKYIVAALVFALIAAGFWYQFFGRKPRVVMTVPLKETERTNGCWAAGEGQILLVTGKEVKLCDIGTRSEKWSVQIPPEPVVDVQRRDALNARFSKLQQWAEELAVKRSVLTTQEATLQFNNEVVKYQTELSAARAAATQPAAPKQAPAPAVPAVRPAAAVEPAHVFGGDRSKVDKLNSAVVADVKLIEERIKRRATKIADFSASIESKRTAAKTDFQKNAVKDDEKRLVTITAEQKADEDTFAKLQPGAKPKTAEETQPDVPPPAVQLLASIMRMPPQAMLIGDIVWVADGAHVVALESSTGQVKQDVPLAGLAQKMFRGESCAFILAEAGAEACQITRLASGAAPQSLYAITGRKERAFLTSPGGDREANVQTFRAEFGGQLVRADIRLLERRLKARDTVNPVTEKKLTQTISQSAGNSNEELVAISKLMANDAQRLMGGEGREMLDDSTYEVTLRNPFDPAAPAWKGQLRGRVQIVSKPHLNFLTAGTQLFAFTPDNKKIWEATLGAPLAIRECDAEHPCEPWLEAGSTLYFADGAFLTSFDIASGRVQWRLPSIGIRKLQLDADGNLYVACDNLPADSLYYALDADSSLASPSVMKVSAPDGRILWQADKYQDVWVSGKDVYAFRELHNAADFQNAVFDRSKVVEARTKIYKLKRSDGKMMWKWFQPRRPRAVVADKKYVTLLFGDELQVIHSISL